MISLEKTTKTGQALGARNHTHPLGEKAKGFTLIELLVVIGIISLLVAVLLPALGSARDSARQAVCLSNLRQVAIGVTTFAQDHDGMLPGVQDNLSSGSAGLTSTQASWFFSLEPFLGIPMSDIARCPSDESALWDGPTTPGGPQRVVSYASNNYLSGRLNGFEAYQSLDAIRSPTQTIFAGEVKETGIYAVLEHLHPELWWIDPEAKSDEQIEWLQHRPAPHWVHLDGHVASDPLEAVYQFAPGSTISNVLWEANRFNPKIAR